MLRRSVLSLNSLNRQCLSRLFPFCVLAITFESRIKSLRAFLLESGNSILKLAYQIYELLAPRRVETAARNGLRAFHFKPLFVQGQKSYNIVARGVCYRKNKSFKPVFKLSDLNKNTEGALSYLTSHFYDGSRTVFEQSIMHIFISRKLVQGKL